MTKKVNVGLDVVIKLLYPRPVVLITCIDSSGKPNIIPMVWSMPTSFDPPLMAISVALTRHSHKLIAETREFVVNVPTEELAKQVDYLGSVSGCDVDKFKASKLTALPAKKIRSPLIGECIAHLECKVVSKLDTGDHTIFIGRVVSAQANRNVFKTDYDLDKVKPIFRYKKSYLTLGEYVQSSPF